MDRTTRNALLLAMLGGLAVSGNAIGQARLQGPAMDSDGDGLVSIKEHAAGARAMFERMDADHDGHVTAAEMDAGHGMMMRRGDGMQHPMPGMGMGQGMPAGGMMAMMDTDRDGAISAQEHAADAKARFDKLDADHDGRITAAEFAAAHAMLTKEVRVIRHGPGMPAMTMGMGMGAGMGPWMSSPDTLRRMDRDGDGKVSATEHAAGAQALFNEADTNKDGKLSAAERSAHWAAMMKRATGEAVDKDDDGR